MRRDKTAFEFFRCHMAGQIFENFIGIPPHIFITGKKRKISVDAGGNRVIIAGADMRIGYQLAMLAAHHQRHFQMDFQIRQPISNLNTGPA